MKHIKDITISIFAIIGFAFVLSSFTSNETSETQEVVYGTPESHVWEVLTASETSQLERVYTLNKVTGEVRKYSKLGMVSGKLKNQYYQVLTENKEGQK